MRSRRHHPEPIRPARRGRGTIARLAATAACCLLIAWPTTAAAQTACDQLRALEPEVELLETAREDLWTRERELEDRLFDARHKAAGVPGNDRLIADLEARIDAKKREIAVEEGVVDRLQAEARGEHLAALQAEIQRAQEAVEAAAKELSRSQAVADRIASDPDVQRLLSAIGELESRIGSLVGADQDLGVVEERIADPKYWGATRSRLWALETNRERRHERAEEAAFDHLTRQLAQLRDEIARDLARRRELKTELEAAEEAARTRLSAKDRKDLAAREQRQAKKASAEKELQTVKERLADGERIQQSAAGRVDGRETGLSDLRGELSQLESDLAAEKARISPEEQAVQEAEAALDEVRSDLRDVDAALAESDRRRVELERRVNAARDRVRDLERRGRAQGRRALAEKRAGDPVACSATLRASQDLLLEASAIARRHAECLGEELLADIERLLGVTDSGDCGSGGLEDLVEVPSVRGLKREKAEAALRAADLEPMSVPLLEPRSAEEAGRAIKTDPPAGTSMRPRSSVTIYHYNDAWVDPEAAREDVGDLWDEAAASSSVTRDGRVGSDTSRSSGGSAAAQRNDAGGSGGGGAWDRAGGSEDSWDAAAKGAVEEVIQSSQGTADPTGLVVGQGTASCDLRQAIGAFEAGHLADGARALAEARSNPACSGVQAQIDRIAAEAAALERQRVEELERAAAEAIRNATTRQAERDAVIDDALGSILTTLTDIANAVRPPPTRSTHGSGMGGGRTTDGGDAARADCTINPYNDRLAGIGATGGESVAYYVQETSVQGFRAYTLLPVPYDRDEGETPQSVIRELQAQESRLGTPGSRYFGPYRNSSSARAEMERRCPPSHRATPRLRN